MDKWTLVPEKKVIYWFDLIFQDNAYAYGIRSNNSNDTRTRVPVHWIGTVRVSVELLLRIPYVYTLS